MAIKCTQIEAFTKSDGTFVRAHERCVDTTTGQVVNSTEGQTETPQGVTQGNPNEICIEIQGYFRSDGTEVKKHTRCIDKASLTQDQANTLERIKASLEGAPSIEEAQRLSSFSDRFLRRNFGDPDIDTRVVADGRVFELRNARVIGPEGQETRETLNGVYEIKPRTDGGVGVIAVSVDDGSINLIASEDRFLVEPNELENLPKGFKVNAVIPLQGVEALNSDGQSVTLDGNYLALQPRVDGKIDVWNQDATEIYTIDAVQEAYDENLTRVFKIPATTQSEAKTEVLDMRGISAERRRHIEAPAARIEEGVLPALSTRQLSSRIEEVKTLRSESRDTQKELGLSSNGNEVCFDIPDYAKADGTIVDSHIRCIDRSLASESNQDASSRIMNIFREGSASVNAIERMDNNLAQIEQDIQDNRGERLTALEQIQAEREALFEKYGGFNAQHNSEFDYLPKSYTDKELEILNEFHIDALQERNELVAELENVETSEVLEYNEIQIEEILRDNAYVYFDNGRHLLDLTGALTDEAGEIQKLDVSSNGDGTFDVGVRTDRLIMDRVVADIYVKNDYFNVSGPYRGQGIGTSVFANQVFQLEQYGHYGIEVQAASGGGYNGFYTWAVLGYQPSNQSFLDEFLDGTPFDFGEFGEITTFEELFAEEGGRKWWKENGSGWAGFFNTRNSEHDYDVSSIDMLNRYLRRKGLRTID